MYWSLIAPCRLPFHQNTTYPIVHKSEAQPSSRSRGRERRRQRRYWHVHWNWSIIRWCGSNGLDYHDKFRTRRCFGQAIGLRQSSPHVEWRCSCLSWALMCCQSARSDQTVPMDSDTMGKYEPLSRVDIGYPKGKFILWYIVYSLLIFHSKAIDYFCLAADTNEDLPPLINKVWADYRLTPSEWKLVKLVHHCLKVCFIYSFYILIW